MTDTPTPIEALARLAGWGRPGTWPQLRDDLAAKLAEDDAKPLGQKWQTRGAVLAIIAEAYGDPGVQIVRWGLDSHPGYRLQNGRGTDFPGTDAHYIWADCAIASLNHAHEKGLLND